MAYNTKKDRQVLEELQQHGWRVAIIWECAIRGKSRYSGSLINRIEEWLKSDRRQHEEKE